MYIHTGAWASTSINNVIHVNNTITMNIPIHIHNCIYIYIYMHMCVYIYIYIHTYIHTHCCLGVEEHDSGTSTGFTIISRTYVSNNN